MRRFLDNFRVWGSWLGLRRPAARRSACWLFALVAAESMHIHAEKRCFYILCGRFATQAGMPSEVSLFGFAPPGGAGARVW